MELTVQEWIFVGEYLRSWNASEAARVAGIGGDWPGQEAYKILKKPNIKAEIDRCQKHAKDAVQLNVNDIVQDIKDVLTADGRELVEQRIGSCRHCWGVDHQYQFKAEELRQLRAKNPDSPAPGGVGYLRKREPHPSCPECEGEGEPYSIIHDTRTLSPSAAALYEGLRPTKNGVEVKMRSKDAAREAAARFLGMNTQKIDLNVEKKVKDMSDDELAVHIAAEMAKLK